MKKFLPVIIIVILLCAGLYAAKKAQAIFGGRTFSQSSSVRRIVSMAPSITETVFALGAGDKLVGVTTFCDYPAQAKKIAKVGGYIDPSMETIVRLKPDIVIVTVENRDTAKKLKELGVRVLSVNQNTVSGIINSISKIGHAIGESQKSDEIVSNIRLKINEVKKQTRGLKRPSVMISIGRSMSGGVGEIYIAGKGNFYDEIVDIAGGVNVYDNKIVKTPALSGEGVIRLNPEIIIDLAPDKHEKDVEKTIADWSKLSHVSAVENKRIHVLTGDYVAIPGPRFIDILSDIAKIIHPAPPVATSR